jgi:hypothetical protein
MKIRLVLAAIALFAQTAAIADSQISGKYPKEQYHWDFGGSKTTLHYTPAKHDDIDPVAKGLVAAPEGWITGPDGKAVGYAPQEITDGGVRVSISELQTNKEKLTPVQYLEQMAQDMGKAFYKDLPAGMATELLSHGEIKQEGDRATISFKMIILGYPAILNITAYPVGDNQMRFIDYFTADDADLIQRYQGIAHKMIEAQYIIDHPNKK